MIYFIYAFYSCNIELKKIKMLLEYHAIKQLYFLFYLEGT